MKVVIILLSVICAACAAPQSDADAVIVKSNFDNIGVDGYRYEYETSNGIQANENGQVLNQGAENEAIAVQGQFQYVGPDGAQYAVQYTADENGFRPQGAHLPVNA